MEQDYKIDAHFDDLTQGELQYAHNMLQMNYNRSIITLNKHDDVTNWRAVQFHFHAPCEHTVDGKQYDVELHIVHQGIERPDSLLVLGVMFEAAEDAEFNEFIDSLYLDELPAKNPNLHVKLSKFMHDIIDSPKLNYSGSLTAPPCTENVEWVLLKEPVKLPIYQVKLFTRLWADNPNFAGGRGNNRELQDLCGRTINIF